MLGKRVKPSAQIKQLVWPPAKHFEQFESQIELQEAAGVTTYQCPYPVKHYAHV